jgi:hypothetical protein
MRLLSLPFGYLCHDLQHCLWYDALSQTDNMFALCSAFEAAIHDILENLRLSSSTSGTLPAYSLFLDSTSVSGQRTLTNVNSVQQSP